MTSSRSAILRVLPHIWAETRAIKRWRAFSFKQAACELLVVLFAALPFTVPAMASPADCIAAVPADGPPAADALKICRKAYDEGGEGAAFLFAYGRALAASGDRSAAERLLGWAVEDGALPAQAARDALAGSDHAAPDPAPSKATPAEPVRTATLPAQETFASLTPKLGTTPDDVVRSVATGFRSLAYPGIVQDNDRIAALREASRPEKAQFLSVVFPDRFPGTATRLLSCPLEPDGAGLSSPPVASLSDRLAASLKASTLSPDQARELQDFTRQWSVMVAAGRAEASALKADLALLAAPGSSSHLPQSVRAITFGFEDSTGWHDFDLVTGKPVAGGSCASAGELAALRTGLSFTLVGRRDDGSETTIWHQETPFGSGVVFGFAEPIGLAAPVVGLRKGEATYTPFLLDDAATFRFGPPVAMPSPATGTTGDNPLGGTIGSIAGAFDTGDASPADATAPDHWQALRLEVGLTGPAAEPDISRFDFFSREKQADGRLAPLAEDLGFHAPFLQLFGITPVIGGSPYAPHLPKADGIVAGLGLLRNIGSGLDAMRRAASAEIAEGATPMPETVGALTIRLSLADGEKDNAGVLAHLVRGQEVATDPAGWAVASVMAESLFTGAPGDARTAISIWQGERARNGGASVFADPAALATLHLPAHAEALAHARLAAGERLLGPSRVLGEDRFGDASWWAVSADGRIVEDEALTGFRQSAPEGKMVRDAVPCKAQPGFRQVMSALSARVSTVAKALYLAANIASNTGSPVDGMSTASEYSQQLADRDVERLIAAACAVKGGGK